MRSDRQEILFVGAPTGGASRFLLNQAKKRQIRFSLIAFAVLEIAIVIAAFMLEFEIIYLTFAPLIILLYLLLPVMPSVRQQIVPSRVRIDISKGTVHSYTAAFERMHSLGEVERVIDYGEWYHIIFRKSVADPFFVCQKSLLSYGTVEDFEALFEGKLESMPTDR
ncbi:MAG: hypothetical protein IJY24_01065 [Clostridia bacterium]|nr:hypothetical protein [Clostridia bacterium]